MKYILAVGFLLMGFYTVSDAVSGRPHMTYDWGFYAHKEINRLAVFTLPQEMLPLYKSRILFLRDHAVDADKRRYATKHEAVRHYMDLDHWGQYPFPELPRTLHQAIAAHGSFIPLDSLGHSIDTILVSYNQDTTWLIGTRDTLWRATPEYHQNFQTYVAPLIYESEIRIPNPMIDSTFMGLFVDAESWTFIDHFSEHGILPYNLDRVYTKLRNAFIAGDVQAILRYSCDIGHYIGDAHVPLHTTKNYNGQLTGQTGIHGLWESRIPELLAEGGFDLLSGRANYIPDPSGYFWNIVFDSHLLVDSVLEIEAELSEEMGREQFCYDERNGIAVRTYCEQYVRVYNQRMGNMVERRMRASIHAVGSAWYSAWVDAGQPDLQRLMDDALMSHDSMNIEPVQGRPFGRIHSDGR